MKINSKSVESLIFLALILLAINFLNINLFGRNDSVVVYFRIVCVALILISFVAKPVFSILEIYLVFATLGAIILGGFSNNIAINICFTMLFVIGTKNIEFEKIVDYSLMALAFSLGLTLLLLYIGVTENAIDSVADRERATFGFSNSNAFTSLVYAFIVLSLYKWKVTTSVKYIAFSLFSYVVFLYTDNRTLIASLLIYVFSQILFHILSVRVILKFVSIFLLLCPILLTQASNLIVNEYPLLDIVLSNRPSFSADFLSQVSGVNLVFGGISPGPAQTIDNSFLLIQAAVGLPFYLLVIWLTFRKLSDCIDKQQANTYSLIFSFWYFSFSESSMVRPEALLGLMFWVLIVRPLNDTRVVRHRIYRANISA